MTAPTISRPDQGRPDTQTNAAGAGSDHPQANGGSMPNAVPPAGSTSSSSQESCDAQSRSAAAGTNLPADHEDSEAPALSVGGDSTWNGAEATKRVSKPILHPSLYAPFLALAADVLDDAERTRIANENRLRQLTRSEEDSDGELRGFGLDESHPDVARLAALVTMLKQIEHQAGLNLQRLLRQHPLGPWVKAQKGIGEKQAARLLAVIGDPYVNTTTGEIRTVSQLWAYCGHGDPARRLTKGMTQAELFTLGNPVAKSRTWLIACAILKSQGPLSLVYYDRKAATEGRTHATDCRRCGPSGRPALAGSPWSDAHRHADALRVTGKAVLKELWLEAKRIHEGETA